MPQPRVVVVTGASAGLGRAIARAFGARGAAVGLIARGEERLASAEAEIRDAGGRALAILADVSDAAALEAAAERVDRELGPIDVWINNAMVSVFSPVKEMTAEEFRRVTEVTYLGYVHGTLAALERMLPRNHGTIVQVGSALAYRAIPLQSAYCAAKHAIQGFHDSLRTELLHERSKVRVTMVQLPAVNTPQFDWVLSRLPRRPQPVPPIYHPAVPARGVVYAADPPPRREYWVGGTTAATMIGNKLGAGLLDRYLARTGDDSQQTDEPVSPERPENLWEPADGASGRAFGTHGRFDDRSSSRSYQLWASEHHGLLGALGGLTAAVALGAAGLRRSAAA